MSLNQFDLFDSYLEKFKALHKAKPATLGPPIVPGDGQIPDNAALMKDFVHNTLSRSKKPVVIRIFNFGLDTHYRIAFIEDTVLQYVAFDLQYDRFIFWTDSEPDGMHPAKAMARVFELEGMEVECDVDAEGGSNMTLYYNGKITRIKDNHDRDDRKISIDGNNLTGNSGLSEDD